MSTDVAVTLPTFTVAAETGFSVTRLREFVTTTLSDSALQVYLDAAVEDVDDVLGPLTVHERVRPHGELLPLSREAESITTVVDYATTLADDDYQLSDSGRTLRRLWTGTNPGRWWNRRVDVTYVREDPVAARWRAVVALVQLDLVQRSGLQSETIGTYSYTKSTTKSYPEQRAEILATLTDSDGIV